MDWSVRRGAVRETGPTPEEGGAGVGLETRSVIVVFRSGRGVEAKGGREVWEVKGLSASPSTESSSPVDWSGRQGAVRGTGASSGVLGVSTCEGSRTLGRPVRSGGSVDTRRVLRVSLVEGRTIFPISVVVSETATVTTV